jgi:hypothetical protein
MNSNDNRPNVPSPVNGSLSLSAIAPVLAVTAMPRPPPPATTTSLAQARRIRRRWRHARRSCALMSPVGGGGASATTDHHGASSGAVQHPRERQRHRPGPRKSSLVVRGNRALSA